MANAYFREEQYFSSSPVIYIVAISFLAGISGSGYLIFQGTGNDAERLELNIAAGIILIVLFFAAWAVFSLRLITVIDSTMITYRMPPFINKTRKITREEVESVTMVTFNPILQYGGYGMRKSIKHGTGYIISGKSGIRIKLKNGKTITLGTQRPELARNAIRRLTEDKE